MEKKIILTSGPTWEGTGSLQNTQVYLEVEFPKKTTTLKTTIHIS